MDDKYTYLRAALDAGPTPGPWKANTSNEIGPISKEDDQSFGMVLPVCFAEFENSEANRRYIAAAHPETIRAPLADYDILREALLWTAATLNNLVSDGHIAEDDLIVMRGEPNVVRRILDSADAALAQEQGES